MYLEFKMPNKNTGISYGEDAVALLLGSCIPFILNFPFS